MGGRELLSKAGRSPWSSCTQASVSSPKKCRHHWCIININFNAMSSLQGGLWGLLWPSQVTPLLSPLWRPHKTVSTSLVLAQPLSLIIIMQNYDHHDFGSHPTHSFPGHHLDHFAQPPAPHLELSSNKSSVEIWVYKKSWQIFIQSPQFGQIIILDCE